MTGRVHKPKAPNYSQGLLKSHLVGRFHERVQSDIVSVDVQLGHARSQVREPEATEHPMHGPITHVGGVSQMVAKVELFHTKQPLRAVGTSRDVDKPRKRLGPCADGYHQGALSSGPRATSRRESRVRCRSVIACDCQFRERPVHFVRRIGLVVRPVSGRHRQAKFDHGRQAVGGGDAVGLEKRLAVVVLFG